jgi:hypothetical protein
MREALVASSILDLSPESLLLAGMDRARLWRTRWETM